MTTSTTAILAAAAGAAALAGGATAQAQSFGYGFGYGGPARAYAADYGRGGWELRDRFDRLELRIDQGRREGWLRGDQAWRLERELRDAKRDAWSARRDGLDGREAGWIDARLSRLSDRLAFLRDGGGYRPRW